jgi:alkylation response protein AidB-like acyl-CoA dehydrogenase
VTVYRLNDSQNVLIEKVRRIADEQIAPRAAEVDAQGRFPREAVEALGGAGFLGLTLPAEFGGMGQGLRVTCAALDEIARRCASTAMVYLMHVCGCACYAAAPHVAGTAMRQASSGGHLSTLAWSEKGSRSHFWAPVSQGVQENGHVMLNAQKSWVTSAGEADGTAEPGRLAVLATTQPFDHCNFTVSEGFPRDAEGRWTEVLFRMRYENPDHREMMDMEGLKAWMPGRTTGYAALAEAVDQQGFFEGSA